jgi:hypothetical protein
MNNTTTIIEAYEKHINNLKMMCITLAIISIVSLTGFTVLALNYDKMRYDRNSYEETIYDYENKIMCIANHYNNLYNDFISLSYTTADIDKNNKDIISAAEKQNEEYKELKHRAELYDKYNYAIINQMDKGLADSDRRTDITYDQIDSLERAASRNGLSEDAVALVLAISMNESRGTEVCTSPESTAAGYCGILDTTGEFIYENIMGNAKGSYDHSLAYNGYLNLEMSLMLIDYLNSFYDGDITRIIKGYRGLYDPTYINNIENNLSLGGKSLYSLEITKGRYNVVQES